MTVIKAALFILPLYPASSSRISSTVLFAFLRRKVIYFWPQNNNTTGQHQVFTNIHTNLPECVHVVAWYGPFQQNLNILSVKDMK